MENISDMKKNTTKRNFEKFTKRNVHKRRSRDGMRRELERLTRDLGVDTSNTRFGRGMPGGDHSSHDGIARGVFSATKSGYGFVRREDAPDVFVPASKTARALDGDYVEVEYSVYRDRDGEEKTDGRITKIIEIGRTSVIGTLTEELVLFGRRRRGYVLVLTPDDPKLNIRPRVSAYTDARPGDKVEVKINRADTPLTCEVIRSFGNALSFGANYEAKLAMHNIETEFSDAALKEAETAAKEPVVTDFRVDKRNEVIFTIDGEGAKDLDDAISLKKLSTGAWQFGVHIADVSHYVKERTALDRAAMSRGTSVYFTDKVVPMLPPAISNGICSLNAHEDKYTLSAVIKISPDGELLSVRLEPSVIRSRVRGVYSEVNAIFDGTASAEIKKKYKEVLPSLRRMHELYLFLKKRSLTRGALELEIPEATVELDRRGEPVGIIRRERGDAEMMIEQFMLAANESVARLLSEKGIPCVYRIHEPPPEEKLTDLITYVKNLGLDVRSLLGGASTDALGTLLKEAERRGLLSPVSYTLLRSMSKARYSSERTAHFGLGISYYCHFTSPIRRLSDLATHRIIHRVILEGKSPERYKSYASRAAVAATEAELRAVGAERDIEDMYKALYMSRFVGDEFDGVINSVTSFGLFVELPNTCEGLVPISELRGVFAFDEKTLTLRSATERYSLADKVTVKLEEADVMRGKLRFSIIKKQ